MTSWKTTAGGILGAVAIGLRHNPVTAPYADIVEAIALALLGLSARDNNVTSEQAGAGLAKSSITGLNGLLIFALAFGVVSSGVVVTGCGTPARKAVQVVGTVTASVDEGMQWFGDYVKAGKATRADVDRVHDAYTKYQAAMAVVESAFLSLKDSGASAAPAWQEATRAAAASKDELMALLMAFRPSR